MNKDENQKSVNFKSNTLIHAQCGASNFHLKFKMQIFEDLTHAHTISLLSRKRQKRKKLKRMFKNILDAFHHEWRDKF